MNDQLTERLELRLSLLEKKFLAKFAKKYKCSLAQVLRTGLKEMIIKEGIKK